MIDQLINFHVRIREDVILTALASRVERALNCHFTSADGEEFSGREALETEVLGLRITLTYCFSSENENVRSYWLTGSPAEDLWGVSEELINVSKFILKVLTSRDEVRWYIPTKEEMLAEAGLS